MAGARRSAAQPGGVALALLATLGALALPLGLFLTLGDPAASALPDDAQGEDIDSGAPATV